MKGEWNFALSGVSLYKQPPGFSATQEHINSHTSCPLFVFGLA